MSHLPFTILAYFLNSISVTTDKLLLNKIIPDPFIYAFYISAFSLISLPVLPFVQTPTLVVFIIGSISTISWTMGAYFLFKALKSGQLSRVIPLIGTFTSLILLTEASINSSITLNQKWAVGFLITGIIFITLTDWKGKLQKKEIIFEIASSVLFAVSFILLREAYLRGNFLSVLAYSRLILIPFIIIVILTPLRKRLTIPDNNQSFKKTGLIFILGQASGGISGFLLQFSMSLASPALVNSLQGIQYVFLLFFGIFFKEKYTKVAIITKFLGIIFIGLGLYILSSSQSTNNHTQIGITYSPKYASQLGLDPRQTYAKILDDFNFKYIRLPVYWDEIETFPGKFNFSQVDYYISEASKKDIQIILTLGYKQPRWPECFDPPWVKKLIRSERDLKILKLVKTEIEYFRKHKNILAWQVENEPFLSWSNCDIPNEQTKIRVASEIAIIKSIDDRPIILTDSGEIGLWTEAIKQSDIFGTTLYRSIWDPNFGVINYPFPPVFYSLKSNFTHLITGKKNQTIISELQMEPWIRDQKGTAHSDIQTQIKDFPVSQLSKNLAYAKETNFSQIYLWGIEWWYFMEQKGYPEYLKKAKTLFNN